MSGHEQDFHQSVVGHRVHPLSVICISVLILFVCILVVLIASDVAYMLYHDMTWTDVANIFKDDEIIGAMRMSIITSFSSLGLVILFSVPIGYALSRYRFRGHAVLNAVVDAPIVLPPVVLGLSLLAFFGTPLGVGVKALLADMGISLVSAVGIVMCQFLVSVSYCIRAMKVTFDSIDHRLELVALSLGCTQWGAFRRVTLPLARSGLVAGGVMAWARAIGVFGPLMVFVGTSPRVQVMPTSMWLELNVGNIEASLALALVTTALALSALSLVHWLSPGRQWA